MDKDTQVHQDVIAELKANPFLYHLQLAVAVQDGIVTISARVNTFAEREAIKRAAQRVAGIRNLILEIRAAAIPDIVSTARRQSSSELLQSSSENEKNHNRPIRQ